MPPIHHKFARKQVGDTEIGVKKKRARIKTMQKVHLEVMKTVSSWQSVFFIFLVSVVLIMSKSHRNCVVPVLSEQTRQVQVGVVSS